MANISIEQELETKNTGSVILKYAIPSVTSGLIAALYNIIDQIFIGNIIGTNGNAATNIAFPFVFLTTAIMLLFGLGGTVNFSIALGKKNLEDAKKYVGVVLLGTPLAAIIITSVTLIGLEPILLLFGATPDTLELAITYVGITSLGYPLYMTTEAATKIIRADGAPKYAMICSVTGALLNCVLNPLFMIGFNMGMKGAAYATVTGQAVSLFLVVRYFFNFQTFKIKIKEIIPGFSQIKSTIYFGTAPASNQLVMMLAQIVLNNIFVIYGTSSIYGAEIPLACVGIISKVTSIYMAVMVGIAQGAQPLLGYSYGAGKPQKVLDIYFCCLKYASILSLSFFAIFQIFPHQILSMFGANGDLFFEFGVKYFRVYLLMTFLNGIQPITFNFFTAIGKPVKSTIVSLSKQLGFLIPLAIILPMILGLDGILYAAPIADTLAFILTFIFIRIELKNLKKTMNSN